MRLPLAFTVLLLASAQALADEMAAPDDLSYWADWADGEQKEELPLPLEHFLQRMARRPRPQQFFGLMGKRDAGYGQISHKRHKTDSFVGLMGKRSLSSDYCSSDLEQEVKEQSFAIGSIELCRIL